MCVGFGWRTFFIVSYEGEEIVEEYFDQATTQRWIDKLNELEAQRVKRKRSRAFVKMLQAEERLLKTFDEKQKELFKVYDEKRTAFHEIDKEFENKELITAEKRKRE